MTLKEARTLKPNAPVEAKNGPYVQHAKVVKVRLRETGGLWITYSWLRQGKQHFATKRHQSVYLPGESVFAPVRRATANLSYDDGVSRCPKCQRPIPWGDPICGECVIKS